MAQSRQALASVRKERGADNAISVLYESAGHSHAMFKNSPLLA
jgi:hypothetical protein